MLKSPRTAAKLARPRRAAVRRAVLIVALVVIVGWLTWEATSGNPARLWPGVLLFAVVTCAWIAALVWITSPMRWRPAAPRRAMVDAEPEQEL